MCVILQTTRNLRGWQVTDVFGENCSPQNRVLRDTKRLLSRRACPVGVGGGPGRDFPVWLIQACGHGHATASTRRAAPVLKPEVKYQTCQREGRETPAVLSADGAPAPEGGQAQTRSQASPLCWLLRPKATPESASQGPEDTGRAAGARPCRRGHRPGLSSAGPGGYHLLGRNPIKAGARGWGEAEKPARCAPPLGSHSARQAPAGPRRLHTTIPPRPPAQLPAEGRGARQHTQNTQPNPCRMSCVWGHV